jgi:hypothetical protein
MVSSPSAYSPPVLLCIFASPRSSPDQIERLIRYLEEKRERHQDEPDSKQVIEGLLNRVSEWTTSFPTEYRSRAATLHDRATAG